MGKEKREEVRCCKETCNIVLRLNSIHCCKKYVMLIYNFGNMISWDVPAGKVNDLGGRYGESKTRVRTGK